MTEAASIWVGEGQVMHTRTRPAHHHFIYPVFCLRIPLRQLATLRTQSHWLFGINRRRLLSFHERDHADKQPHGQGNLIGWLEEQLSAANMTLPTGEIWLQTMPRVLGYVFNPVSFWYMHDQEGGLRAILAAVNNTFGEHHQYLLSAEDHGPITSDTPLLCRKAFHVSPFCNVSGHYRFRYHGHGNRHLMAIDYFDDDEHTQPLIATSISCQYKPATQRHLFMAFCRMPLLTLGVVFRIHWQALQLWLKKTPFYRKPVPPFNSLTHNQRKHGNEKQV